MMEKPTAAALGGGDPLSLQSTPLPLNGDTVISTAAAANPAPPPSINTAAVAVAQSEAPSTSTSSSPAPVGAPASYAAVANGEANSSQDQSTPTVISTGASGAANGAANGANGTPSPTLNTQPPIPLKRIRVTAPRDGWDSRSPAFEQMVGTIIQRLPENVRIQLHSGTYKSSVLLLGVETNDEAIRTACQSPVKYGKEELQLYHDLDSGSPHDSKSSRYSAPARPKAIRVRYRNASLGYDVEDIKLSAQQQMRARVRHIAADRQYVDKKPSGVIKTSGVLFLEPDTELKLVDTIIVYGFPVQLLYDKTAPSTTSVDLQTPAASEQQQQQQDDKPLPPAKRTKHQQQRGNRRRAEAAAIAAPATAEIPTASSSTSAADGNVQDMSDPSAESKRAEAPDDVLDPNEDRSKRIRKDSSDQLPAGSDGFTIVDPRNAAKPRSRSNSSTSQPTSTSNTFDALAKIDNGASTSSGGPAAAAGSAAGGAD